MKSGRQWEQQTGHNKLVLLPLWGQLAQTEADVYDQAAAGQPSEETAVMEQLQHRAASL